MASRTNVGEVVCMKESSEHVFYYYIKITTAHLSDNKQELEDIFELTEGNAYSSCTDILWFIYRGGGGKGGGVRT